MYYRERDGEEDGTGRVFVLIDCWVQWEEDGKTDEKKQKRGRA